MTQTQINFLKALLDEKWEDITCPAKAHEFVLELYNAGFKELSDEYEEKMNNEFGFCMSGGDVRDLEIAQTGVSNNQRVA
jgi:hypothetical protein